MSFRHLNLRSDHCRRRKDLGRCRPEPMLKVPSRHLPGVAEGGKPQSGWSSASIEPTTSRMLRKQVINQGSSHA